MYKTPIARYVGLMTQGIALTGLVALVTGCAGQGSQSQSTTPQPTAVPPDQKPELACPRYAQRLCEAAGPETPTCQAVREIGVLLPPKACLYALDEIDNAVAQLETMRKDCTEVADRLCTRVGPDSPVCAKVRKDMETGVPPGHCSRLLAAYPELEAQLLAQLKREAPLDDAQQEALLVGEPPAFGPSGARVTLVEFSDFQCPYCAMAAAAVKKIKQEYGDRIRFVFRQFPLSFHEHAQRAAEASMAAHAQGKFWELHDLMFENQARLEASDLREYAEKIGLDLKAYDQAVTENAYADAVRTDLALGERVFVNGTPTLFINGKRAQNPTDFDAIKPMIEAALAAEQQDPSKKPEAQK
ncbi:MAG: DsbA family protein [Myxococcales bacterium]|nr:DsbA family protein [Myxococcales bacterium]